MTDEYMAKNVSAESFKPLYNKRRYNLHEKQNFSYSVIEIQELFRETFTIQNCSTICLENER